MIALNKSWPTTHFAATFSLKSRENLPQRNRSAAHFSQSLQRARYYDPSTGEFTSRDPLEYVDGMSLYSGYFQLANSDPMGLAYYLTNIVAKSFIRGIPRIGGFNPDRAGGAQGLAEFFWHQLLLNSTDPEWDLDRLQGALSGLKTATDRLHFLARLVGKLPAFNEDPKSDEKNGKYRLYTRLLFRFEGCDGKLNYIGHKWDNEGGAELPLIDGSIELTVRRMEIHESMAIFEWVGWGHPHPIVEPGMQWVALRTSVNIWHRPEIKIWCDGDKGYHQVLAFLGSDFPSRRLWVNSVLENNIAQGAFSDLWDPHPDNPEFVQ